MILNKSALENPFLSFEAKGLWAYLMSRPDNWNVSVTHISKTFYHSKKRKLGEAGVLAILNELIKFGYCHREQPKQNDGKFSSMDYVISEYPEIKKDSTKPQLEGTDIPCTGKPQRYVPLPAQPRPAADPPNNIEVKEIYISNNISSPTSPSKEQRISPSASGTGVPAADAAEKRVKKKEIIPEEAKILGDSIVEALLQEKPTYSAPKNRTKIYLSANKLLTEDKRDAIKVLQVLKWALADDFWRDKMFRDNTASYLSGARYDSLEEKMNARPMGQKVDRRTKDRNGKPVEDSFKDNLF